MLSLIPGLSGASRVRRRDLLQWGASSAGAAWLLGRRACGAAGDSGPSAKRCIYIYLCGGPSQGDLWDMKPDAPEGIRSVFQSIDTSVPGIRFSELIPQVARHADKLALIRSMSHDNNNHGQAIAKTLLGDSPARVSDEFADRHDHPGLGGIVHRVRGSRGVMPNWVVLPRPFTTLSPPHKGQHAGFLGSAFDPIVMDKEKKGSLSDRPLRLDAFQLPESVDALRLAERRRLVQGFGDASSQELELEAVRSHAAEVNRAYDMLSASAVQQAFDISRESDAIRDRYGRNEYGQSFLLARRLVEAGVDFVNVFWTFFDEKGCQFNLWDNHGVVQDVCGVDGQFTGVQQLTHAYCTPSFDRSFSALLEDLHQRGLLHDTLVVIASEFGRTPRINATNGRDHWAHAYTQLLAGGGVRGGQIYGASDAIGAFVKDQPVSPSDFSATILTALGVDSEFVLHDQLGRPVRASSGNPVRAIF